MSTTEPVEPGSPSPPFWARGVRVVVASYILLVAVMLPVNILYQEFLIYDLSNNGQEVSAELTGNTPCRIRASQIPCRQLEWVVEGKVYRRDVPTSTLKDLATIRVRYSPWDPSFIELLGTPSALTTKDPVLPRLLLATTLGLIFGISALGVLRQR